MVGMCVALASPALAKVVSGTLASAAGQPETVPPVKSEPKQPENTEPKKEVPGSSGAGATPTAPAAAAKENRVYIQMKTSMGDIFLELDSVKAPISTANFQKYADKGFYDGTIFHRVIPRFMIQCGGMLPNMSEKPTDAPIKNEWQNGLKNTRGTVAMARKGAGPDSANSATSQFYVNTKDNDSLDRPQGDGAAYAVFGKVIGGMEVVDAIEKVKTGSKNPHGDVPLVPIVIEQVKVVTKAQADEAMKSKK